MKNPIKMAAGLDLPLDTVTQTIGILAKKRSGKSYTARRLVEQLALAELQVVIVDPKGDWWGIRSAANGKDPGLSVAILGGEHGDIPLEPGGGELVAKLVAEDRASVLLDLSLFRKHEVATFMAIFLETLYRIKAREQFRTPMMLMIDEADAIAPQKPQPNEARMLGAASDIVRKGGQRGIGCTMVSQRSAILAKDVLTQIQMLVTLRTIAPQDLAAIKLWVDNHGTPEQCEQLMSSLPSLQVGNGKGKSSAAWFWSPGWPTAEGIFCQADVLPIMTFDSGKTPEPGEKRVEPKKLAEIDLELLGRQMKDTIERAKDNDPKLLRKKIAELELQLAKKPAVGPAPPAKIVEVPVVPAAELTQLEGILGRVTQAVEDIYRAGLQLAPIRNRLEDMEKTLKAGISAARQPRPVKIEPLEPLVSHEAAYTIVDRGFKPGGRRRHGSRPAPPMEACDPVTDAGGDLPGPCVEILRAMATFAPASTSRARVGAIVGIKPKGSSMRKYLGVLRTRGLARGGPEALELTPAGLAAAGGAVEQPKTTAELLELWCGKFPKAVGWILREVVEARKLSRADLVQILETEYELTLEPHGSSLRKYIGMLRSAGLLEQGEPFTASDSLYP